MTLLEMKGQNDKSVEKDRGESHAGWRDYRFIFKTGAGRDQTYQ